MDSEGRRDSPLPAHPGNSKEKNMLAIYIFLASMGLASSPLGLIIADGIDCVDGTVGGISPDDGGIPCGGDGRE